MLLLLLVVPPCLLGDGHICWLLLMLQLLVAVSSCMLCDGFAWL
jgi:hypothetical protein